MKKLNQRGIGAGIIIAIVAVVLLGGGYYAYKTKTGGSPSEMKNDSQLEESAMEEDSNENYSGTIQKMMKLGIPLKCTYSVDGNSYEGYMKGDQFRGNMESADGTKGGIAMKANCMYVWNEGETQGFKMCLEDVESFIDDAAWDELDSSDASVSASANTNYNCRPAIVTDAQLEPPSDVTFMTMDELINSMMQENGMPEGFEGMMEE